jgi:glutathione S-transferase
MYQLYLGNKNYSSWSLRGFLAMKLSGAPFVERMVSLSGTGDPSPGNRAFSPTGRVPLSARRRNGRVGFAVDCGIPRRAASRNVACRSGDARVGSLGRRRNALGFSRRCATR